MSKNLILSQDELKAIRELDDFDLIMLLSEIHDHGWPSAKVILDVLRNLSDGKNEAAE